MGCGLKHFCLPSTDLLFEPKSHREIRGKQMKQSNNNLTKDMFGSCPLASLKLNKHQEILNIQATQHLPVESSRADGVCQDAPLPDCFCVNSRCFVVYLPCAKNSPGRSCVFFFFFFFPFFRSACCRKKAFPELDEHVNRNQMKFIQKQFKQGLYLKLQLEYSSLPGCQFLFI